MTRGVAIELVSVRARRGDRIVLEDVTFRVDVGERVAILGPNGIGKSSLLDVILGVLPSEGSVKVMGRARAVGFVGQDPDASLLPWLTVRENVELPLRLRGVPAAARARAFDEVRGWLDPQGRVDPSAEPRALSGGERQIVALLRAWVLEPELVVLDEPLSAIDPLARAATRAALVRACDRSPETTVLFVSHDLDDVVALADRALVLGGRPARVRAEVEVGDGGAIALIGALADAERATSARTRPANVALLPALGSSRA